MDKAPFRLKSAAEDQIWGLQVRVLSRLILLFLKVRIEYKVRDESHKLVNLN